MRRAAGFTIIELVMVIVLLSIVSLISVRFVSLSMEGAIDTANRQRLGMAAGVVSEQLSRELRSALTNSIRVSGDQRCIEFIPILSGSRYTDIPLNSAEPSFEAVSAGPGQGATGHVAVYPYAGDPYNPGSPGVVTEGTTTLPDSGGEQSIAFGSGAHQFKGASPTRRFFIVGEPVAFRQVIGSRFLYRYSGYGFQSSVCDSLPISFSASGATREVVATPLMPDSLRFDFVPPALQRNGVVTFEFDLQSTDSEESIGVSQEVQVRNVP